MSGNITVWGRPTSTRTLRVLWTLAEIGLDFDLVLASGTMGAGGSIENGNAPYGIVDTPDYRAMNPMGTVPTIRDGDFTLCESNSITRYLAMKYAPDLLYGDDIETFARASRWMDWDNNEVIESQHTLVLEHVRLRPEQRDSQRAAMAHADQARLYGIVDEQLGRTPFIAGDTFSMGDIGIGIHCHRWHLYGLDYPDLPNVARWYAPLRQRPAWAKWVEPREHHLVG
ncbi:MAG: glutathione S-transferase family protein [Paracoccaceae bacterium]|nr:glutathione S-transferase family protein [Paracoccaceae bacterium]